MERFLNVLGFCRAGGVDEEELLRLAFVVADDHPFHRLDAEEAGHVRHADFFLNVHRRLRAALNGAQPLRERHPHEVLALRQHQRARAHIRDALVQPGGEREARRVFFENIRATEHREAELFLQRRQVHAVRELQRRHDLLHRRGRRVGVELDLRHRRHEGRRLRVHFVAFEQDVLGKNRAVERDAVFLPRRPVVLRVECQACVAHPFPHALHGRLHADARRHRQSGVIFHFRHRRTEDDRQHLRLQFLRHRRHARRFHLYADRHRFRLPLPPVVSPPATCGRGEDEQRRQRTPPRTAPHRRAGPARGLRKPARRFPRKIAEKNGEALLELAKHRRCDGWRTHVRSPPHTEFRPAIFQRTANFFPPHRDPPKDHSAGISDNPLLHRRIRRAGSRAP